MSEILDFGVFGKWSKKTLIAQSEFIYFCSNIILPESISIIERELTGSLEKLLQTRVKKLTVRVLIERMQEIEKIKIDLKQYDKITGLLTKHYYKSIARKRKWKQQ